jgi:hypothetical protein
MKIRIVLMTTLVAAAAGGPAAWAQRADQPPTQPDTARFGDPTDTARQLQGFVYGVVNKVNSSEIVCDKTEFGDGQAFKLDKKTKYIRDGKPASLAGLKAGDEIWVRPKRDKKTGEMIALSVMMGVPPVEAK